MSEKRVAPSKNSDALAARDGRTKHSRLMAQPLDALSGMQRNLGNRAVGQFFGDAHGVIQRKCSCGGDCPKCKSEQEDGSSLPSSSIQTKLSVGSPGDVFERQADGVAATILDSSARIPSIAPTRGAPVQASGNAAGGPVSNRVNSGILSRVGRGSPLPTATRGFMESRFQKDFSQVRVHSDSASGELSRDLHADAFTTGRDIFFASGKFEPGNSRGKQLLAHELTHVVQQNGLTGAGPIQCKRTDVDDPKADYNIAVQNITGSDQYAALSADEQKLVDSIIATITAGTDDALKVDQIAYLKTLFKRGVDKADVDSAVGSLVALGVDKAKLKKLVATLSKPFLGYTASGFDFSKRFFRHADKLGLQVDSSKLGAYGADPYDRGQPSSVTDPADESFKKSDVLFFSGHQYAQYKEPGNFTNDSSDSCFNIGMLPKDNKRVKLAVSTSCATICKDVAKIWRAKFPDALILGYRFSAPLDGSKVANTFAAKLAKAGSISLSDASGLATVRAAWKAAVIAEGSLDGGPALLYGGEVEFYEKGKWITKPWDDKANECHYH
jgi:Domain of unknown function (DUF4157)